MFLWSDRLLLTSWWVSQQCHAHCCYVLFWTHVSVSAYTFYFSWWVSQQCHAHCWYAMFWKLVSLIDVSPLEHWYFITSESEYLKNVTLLICTHVSMIWCVYFGSLILDYFSEWVSQKCCTVDNYVIMFLWSDVSAFEHYNFSWWVSQQFHALHVDM